MNIDYPNPLNRSYAPMPLEDIGMTRAAWNRLCAAVEDQEEINSLPWEDCADELLADESLRSRERRNREVKCGYEWYQVETAERTVRWHSVART